MLSLVLAPVGALGALGADSLPLALAPVLELVLSVLAGAAAASFMHFSFSAPLSDSQFGDALACPELLLLSPVALWLWLELCANKPGEKASKADASVAPSNFTFIVGSFSKWNCDSKGANAMPCMR